MYCLVTVEDLAQDFAVEVSQYCYQMLAEVNLPHPERTKM